MPRDFKLAARASGILRRVCSMSFWLQAAACAVVAGSLLHGGSTLRSAAPRATVSQIGGDDAAAAAGATTAPADRPADSTPAGTGLRLDVARAAAATPSLASTPSLESAKLALSTIDVIVTRNDTLDRIFRRLKLNLADLASLRSLPGVRAALDSLRPGELLHLTHHGGELFGLERRLSETQTLKVSREGDALKADVLQNPIEMRTRTIRGVIDSSLFEAVEATGAHDQTAVGLADIFGWDIDFVLDVRPGDTFVVTYEEIWRDGTYLRDGPIQAAEFVNQGREFRAVRYTDPEGHSNYYTPEGRSLHKAFLRTPVEFSRVSSRFNSARHHPILNLIRAHKGVDYAAPIGTPVHAAGDGRIRFAGSRGGYGNCVEIEHSRSIVTLYGHLSRFARGTRTGAHVTQGAVIAYVGMTGLATGPHLHYEYRVNGVFKNPQTVALPASAPIDAGWRADFLARSAPLLAGLDAPAGPMLVSR
ncbi:MAG TPA: peptidoglycan DD-metalloendopeptidase family protein [Steroidobacteraceae bacterium]|nr:peptidoglycan DD-metalloendopeptidase family protein [Steroidobacteraceae bacterium]